MPSPWFAWISPKPYKALPFEYGLPPPDEPFDEDKEPSKIDLVEGDPCE